jgi:hypothetical protein
LPVLPVRGRKPGFSPLSDPGIRVRGRGGLRCVTGRGRSVTGVTLATGGEGEEGGRRTDLRGEGREEPGEGKRGRGAAEIRGGERQRKSGRKRGRERQREVCGRTRKRGSERPAFPASIRRGGGSKTAAGRTRKEEKKGED